MSPLLDLLILCLAMAGGTFFFGLLPLGLRLSRLTLRILEVGGAGLLLGAAASVVMPEGAGALFRSEQAREHKEHGHEHEHRRDMLQTRGGAGAGIEDAQAETLLAVSFLAGMLVLFVIDQIMSPGPHIHAPSSHNHDEAETEEAVDHHDGDSCGSHHVDRPHHERHLSRMSRPESMILTRSNAVPTLKSISNLRNAAVVPAAAAGAAGGEGSRSPRNASPESSDGSVPGLPADYYTLPRADNVESAYRKQQQQQQRRSSSSNHSTPSSPLLGATRSPPSSPPRNRHRHSHASFSSNTASAKSTSGGSIDAARGLRAAFTSIAGLLIHAACDGIAMGASAASRDEGLKLVVVGAILLHKAPAAFGLCTLLISRGLSRTDIRKAMGIFSLATPVGALGTYFLLSIALGGTAASDSGSGSGSGSSPEAGSPAISPSHVGTALTFSAGSFIYVALDAVHELASSSSDYERGPDGRHIAKMTLGRTGRIATLLAGAVLPKTLQIVFGHGH